MTASARQMLRQPSFRPIIVLSGGTFCLGHVLIGSVPGKAITIAHGDRDVVAADDRDRMRWRPTTRKVRRLLRRKITPRYRTLDVAGAQAPLAAFYGRGFNKR